MKRAAIPLLLVILGFAAPNWKEIDRLVSEQKLEEASKAVAAIRAEARGRGDAGEETKALVREVQLREALHGYETAVRFLREEPWPKGVRSQAILNLFYADALVTYARDYSWEIGRREKVETRGVVDLRAWTRDQIMAEAARAFAAVWNERESLGKEDVSTLSEFVEVNDYPRTVRGTVRDAVSYLFVAFLADTAGWRPEDSNELFALDRKALIAGNPAGSAAVKLDDPAVHPLLRIGAILDDLEEWHRSRGEREAELEARLERLRRLGGSFTDASDRDAIRADLERRLPAFRGVAWWAMGEAELSEMVRAEDRPDALVRARAIAREGARAFPHSVGGRRCESIVAGLDAPDYQIASMSSDGPEKRSIEVKHRNLPALFFRAYRFDLETRLAAAKDYNLLPAWRELEQIVRSEKPVEAWSVELPPTPDLRTHRTFVTPPLPSPGAYAIVASARQDFAKDGNRLFGVHLIVSDLVMAVRQTDRGGIEARVVSGSRGTPVAGASVALWKLDWQSGHHRLDSAISGTDGLVTFEPPSDRGGSYFLVAKKGADAALDPSASGFWRSTPPPERSAALVYTDRSVYRPLQEILWKVVAYRGHEARFSTLPETLLTVSLHDANGQAVETKSVKTNGFGTAAGEFAIPAGRLLGGWSIRTSLGGSAGVQVEEYKRPTFEVTLKEPAEALRLNRPATLRGEARYYFGLPVASGLVRWRVTREPVWPSWGWWRWSAPSVQVQTVATGTATLREDGSFEMTFTPKADEKSAEGPGANRDVTWRYAVRADVTDEGGETRSADRRFRLGFVAVEARIERSTNFFLEGKTASVSIARTDLDGGLRAGKGVWRLIRLVPPEKTLLPADLPSKNPEYGASRGENDADEPGRQQQGVRTPGDRLRPRWDTRFSAEEWMRDWPEGAEVASGATEHDAKGEARIEFGKLRAGAYRLLYETEDGFGGRFTLPHDFLVASPSATLPMPALLLAESPSVTVGGTVRLVATSGIPGETLFFDVVRAGHLAERRILTAGKDAALIEIPVTESDRGGLAATLTAVRDHQLLQQTATVFVPWDDRELKVSFATFRDRLRPGVKETWRVTVTGATPDHPLTGSAELLAYMYDRSLDLFAPHQPPSPLSLYPTRTRPVTSRVTLGQGQTLFLESTGFGGVPGWPVPRPDRLKFEEGYGIGGPGLRGRVVGGVAGGVPAPAMAMKAARGDQGVNAPSSLLAEEGRPEDSLRKKEKDERGGKAVTAAEPPSPVTLRSDFSETAFFMPQLLTGPDGSATIEFTVPDSVTSWNVWVHALTRDLRSGSLHRETRTVKELMVRPYVPRFLREGDEAELKVVVNNASERDLAGRVVLDVIDPETNASLLSEFGVLGWKRGSALLREGRRRDEPFVPTQGSFRREDGRLQGRRDGRRLFRRRASSAADPPGADASRPVALRHAEEPGLKDAPVRGPCRPRDESRPDARERKDGRDGRRAALLLGPEGAAVPRQLPVRVHGADAEPVPLDRNRLVALPRLSGRREDGGGVLETDDPSRELGRGRPEPEDGPRGDAVARRGDRRARRRARPDERSRPPDREGRPRGGAREAEEGPDLGRRIPLVAGRSPFALHDALPPPRLRESDRIRHRGAEGDGPAGVGVRRLPLPFRLDVVHGEGRLLGVDHLPQLRRDRFPRPDLVGGGLHAGGADEDARLQLPALEEALADAEGVSRADPLADGAPRRCGARLALRHGLGEDERRAGDLLRPRGAVVALVQRHG